MASARVFQMITRSLTALALAVASGASCGDAAPEVVPYTSVDQVFSELIFRSFEEESDIRPQPRPRPSSGRSLPSRHEGPKICSDIPGASSAGSLAAVERFTQEKRR